MSFQNLVKGQLLDKYRFEIVFLYEKFWDVFIGNLVLIILLHFLVILLVLIGVGAFLLMILLGLKSHHIFVHVFS